MITPVTPQDFRDIDHAWGDVSKHVHRALIAAAEQGEQLALLHDILHSISVDAMTAQSDPHASAADYRKALVILCNRAMRPKPQEAK